VVAVVVVPEIPLADQWVVLADKAILPEMAVPVVPAVVSYG
jgi:hypothetical protein